MAISSEDQQRARDAMLAHINSANEFTWSHLYAVGDHAINQPFGTCDRLADRILQRERKAGRIHQPHRRGVWSRVSS